MENTRNIYEMAKGIKPIPDENNSMQKLYFKTIPELKSLREKQKLVVVKEHTFNESLASMSGSEHNNTSRAT